jgi:hypothetical protein
MLAMTTPTTTTPEPRGSPSPKAFAFRVAGFLRNQSRMGASQKFWFALVVALLPGGLILAPAIWFVQRWWRQRSPAAHPTLHPHPSLHA